MGVIAVTEVVTLLVIYRPRQQPAPTPMTAKAPANISAPSVAKIAPPVQPSMPHRPPRSAPRSWVDARPQQFPTPRPLSEQEKLLLVNVQSLKGSSAASMQMADENAEHDLEIPPLSIAAIKIEPLALAEKSGDEK
jgi:hypothetical protein